jgi:hypothetical protein
MATARAVPTTIATAKPRKGDPGRQPEAVQQLREVVRVEQGDLEHRVRRRRQEAAVDVQQQVADAVPEADHGQEHQERRPDEPQLAPAPAGG